MPVLLRSRKLLHRAVPASKYRPELPVGCSYRIIGDKRESIHTFSSWLFRVVPLCLHQCRAYPAHFFISARATSLIIYHFLKSLKTLSRCQVVEVSATSRLGLEALEEALLLQAELMDIRADVTREAEAVVLEARQDKGQGPLASMIVKCGTLRPGAHVVVGQLWGKVRALRDMSGQLVKAAGPSMPVEVLGLKGLPETGDEVLVVASEERARKIAEGRAMQADRKKRDSTVMVRGSEFCDGDRPRIGST
jgi:hypothetical protein